MVEKNYLLPDDDVFFSGGKKINVQITFRARSIGRIKQPFALRRPRFEVVWNYYYREFSTTTFVSAVLQSLGNCVYARISDRLIALHTPRFEHAILVVGKSVFRTNTRRALSRDRYRLVIAVLRIQKSVRPLINTRVRDGAGKL